MIAEVEPEPEKHVGLDGATFFIIAAGIVAFILILVLARYFNTNSSKITAIELQTERATGRDPEEETKVKADDGENGQIVEEGIN